MKIITIFLHRRITMKITMINNYNWITIYFYIFIFMLNFFLLFVDCILQTIGNDIKSSNYIMYFIKILYHETKVLIINCDEVWWSIRWSSISKLLWWSSISKLLWWRFDEVLSLNITMKYSMKCDEVFDEVFNEDVMKYSMKMWWRSIT